MRSYSCCDSSTTTAQAIQPLASLLKVVGEASRLRLLCILRDGGEHCVCELADHADDLSQSLISHHLSDLKAAGLVSSHKQGLRAYYQLTDDGRHVVQTIFSLLKEGANHGSITNRSCRHGVCDLPATVRDHPTRRD